jgi:CDP-glucose 4,6-dehydratase
MPIEEDRWRGRRVLLTGHTGFKGAWLSLWLQRLGAQVSGIAPGAPSDPSLYRLAEVSSGMAAEYDIDVRDRDAMRSALTACEPEVVLHLAAQPMVRRSLIEPAETYEINVIGTVNLLEAVRLAGDSVRAVVVVTSDKCYENPGRARSPQAPGAGGRAFREGDPLGGSDPYSSSKACAELVVASYRRSFFSASESPRLATARAGNVIGGGDWGQDRLLGDLVRVAGGIRPAPMTVRNPDAIRPWQHVLNPLMGYLMLAERLLVDAEACQAWNFGPPESDARSVGSVLERLCELWEGAPAWEIDAGVNPKEAFWLALDSSLAHEKLGWQPAWSLDEGLSELVDWHRAHLAGQDMRQVSERQIERFTADASDAA